MPTRAVLITLFLLLTGATVAHAQGDQLARRRQAVQSMAGCYLVDYSYVEVQELKPGYVRDPRIMVYGPAQGGSWLERQDNVKTIHTDSGRGPLVRQPGKNWYVRLPDAECAGARAFAERRRDYWALLRETWDGILDGSGPFTERAPAGQPPRFVKMFEVEDDAIARNLADPAVREAVRQRIRAVIEDYRAR